MKRPIVEFSLWLALSLYLVAFPCHADDANNLQSNTIQRLTEIKLPVIDFKDTPIEQAAKTLTDLSAKYSPDGKGVSIFISTATSSNILAVPSNFDQEMTQAAENIMKISYPDADPIKNLAGRKITLHLINVTLKETLFHVVSTTNTVTFFHVRTNGTVVIGYDESNLEARAYSYSNKVFDAFESPQIVFACSIQSVSPIHSFPKRKLLVIVEPANEWDLVEKTGIGFELTRVLPKPAAPFQ